MAQIDLDPTPLWSLVAMESAIDRLPDVGPAASGPAKALIARLARLTSEMEHVKGTLRKELSPWSDHELRAAGLWTWPEIVEPEADEEAGPMDGATLRIGLVPHGYQIDCRAEYGGVPVFGSECRDYGGDIEDMREAVQRLVEMVRTLDKAKAGGDS